MKWPLYDSMARVLKRPFYDGKNCFSIGDEMQNEIKDFWLNIDSWNIDQLAEAKQIITNDIKSCRDEMLQAGLSDFARNSLVHSMRIQGNMIVSIDKRIKDEIKQ